MKGRNAKAVLRAADDCGARRERDEAVVALRQAAALVNLDHLCDFGCDHHGMRGPEFCVAEKYGAPVRAALLKFKGVAE